MKCRSAYVYCGSEYDIHEYERASAEVFNFILMKTWVAAEVQVAYKGDTLSIVVQYNPGCADVIAYTPTDDNERLTLAWLTRFITRWQWARTRGDRLDTGKVYNEEAAQQAVVLLGKLLPPEPSVDKHTNAWVQAYVLAFGVMSDEAWSAYEQFMRSGKESFYELLAPKLGLS